MMKIFFLINFFLLFMNFFNKFILQVIYQNLMFYVIFLLIINYPMNNLNFYLKMYYYMGMDFYSMGLIVLSIWILAMMLMISGSNSYNFNYLIYFQSLSMLLVFLILCFMMMNLMMFYLFFEASLIPIFFLILGWGYQVDRVQAGLYMMLYTLIGSLPLLIMIMLIYQLENSLMFSFIELNFFNILIYLMLNFGFLVKMPMYFLHLWLPKAHVEAPLVGSMILAGILLKLGSYGFLRFMMSMFNLYLKYNKFLIIISLLGGIYSSLICLYQVDLKVLVAYSSIVHMSILMAGLMTMMNWGILGGYIMMIAHGLCSSGLFCLVNINYDRFKSRSLFINKGLINLFPMLSLMWFLLCSSNMSFPPSLNFFSEIILINSLIVWSKNLIYLLMFLMFFSALYTLYMYSYSQHGEVYKFYSSMKNIMIMEYLILILHWLPLNLMFFMIYMFF